MTRNLAVLILSSLLLSACGGIGNYINKKFPPVTIQEQQERAKSTAITALEGLQAPNLAFGVSLAEVRTILLSTERVAAAGITDIRLRSLNQLLKIDADFDRTFTSADGAEGTAKEILGRLKPRVVGTATVYAGITGAAQAKGDESSVLRLKLLPAFETVSVSKVTAAEEYDVTALGDVLASVLNRYADNITGELSRLPVMNVEVPARFAETLDPNRTVRINNPDIDGHAKFYGKPVAVPIKLRGIAPMIDENHVVVLAQFEGVSASNDEREPDTNLPDKPLSELLRLVLRDGFALQQFSDPVWVAVRKDLVSFAANDLFRQASLCASVKAGIARQRFSETVTFPDETTVDCTPTRDCTPKRSCDFRKSHDTRNCSACLLRKPFGGCLVRGNDPFCEAAKASQNAAYELDYVARKADCERLKSTEKLSCEAEKSGERALCETGKEFLKRLARTGKFANIEGGYSGSSSLAVCLREFALSQNLDRVHAVLEVAGAADIDVSLKFVPLDIVGHLTCQVPWTESQRFVANVPNQLVQVSAALRFAEGDAPGYTFDVAETQVDLRIRPGPTELLLSSTNMTLACRGPDLIKPLLIPATRFIPELRGDFKYKTSPMAVTTLVKLPTVELAGRTLKASIAETVHAIVLRGATGAKR